MEPGPRVLAEDADLIALDKPSGLLVVAGRGPAAREPTLRAQAERSRGKTLFVVHRLDREASGVVVFAKTAGAHVGLCGLFEARQAKKTYSVAVLGSMPGRGRIESPLKERGSGRVSVEERGKPALTLWRCVESTPRGSLLEVGLVTGRRHQIRVHCYAAGHPVLGDPLYGEERPVGGARRLMLHAWRLELPGKPPIVSPPPADFLAELSSRGLPAPR